VRVVLAILWKDLVSEWRSRERISAMLVFALLVVVVFHFALPSGTGAQIESNAAGLLWVAYVFAALLGQGRAFAQELENDALAGLALAPLDRGAVFAGKALSSFALTSAVELLVAVAFALAFGVDWLPRAAPLAGVVALATFGICAIGTLLSAMAVRTRLRELVLPILLMPALFPLLAGAVSGTAAAIAGQPIPFEALQLLLVIDGVYATVGLLAFEYVLDE